MQNDISQAVLDRIQEQGIEPRSAWLFQAHRVILWVGGVVCMIGGGIAFASLLYLTQEQEWVLAWEVGMFWRALPVVWLAGFFAFLFLGIRDVQGAPKGYKYESWLVATAVFVGSVGIGGVVYAAGYEHVPDRWVRETVPVYQELAPSPEAVWHQPDQGRYAGMLIATSTEEVTLEGIDGERYVLQMASTSLDRVPGTPRFMDVGSRIKLRGSARLMDDTSQVTSSVQLLEARPWFKREALQERDDRPERRRERIERRDERFRFRERLRERKEEMEVR